MREETIPEKLLSPKGAIVFSEQLVYLNTQSLKATSNYQKSPICFLKETISYRTNPVPEFFSCPNAS